MRAIFERSGRTAGSLRVHRALVARGDRIRRRRVERLMRAGGWRARVARVYRRTAGTHRWFAQHPHRVRRTQASGLTQIWVGDRTSLTVAGRWWYLAAILDQGSRRVLAWRLAATRDATFTRGVVAAALRRRRPKRGLIFHSDRGSEFLGPPCRQRLVASGVQHSMTRGGAPDENAHMESCFHSLQAEVIHGRSCATGAELPQALRR